MADKRFGPTKIAVLLDVATEVGLDPAAVLEGTQLDLEATRNPLTLTSPLQFLVAARNALNGYAGDDLGMRVGSRLHAPAYGMYGYALLCSETLRHGFEMSVKYHRIANSMIPIKWIEDEGLLTWVYPAADAVTLPGLDDRLYRFLIEFQISVAATLFADAMGPWCQPVQATLALPKPAHADQLSRALQCPVSFDQPRHTLSYPAEWLTRAPRMASPIDAARVSAECAKLMDDVRRQTGVTRRVYQELTRSPGRFPEIDAIAETLCVTARTLRRRLEFEGTSYRELLANVRKALAMDYLSTTLMSTEDIAGNLGFSDPVAFRHAFKRWTGKSPLEFRQGR